MKRIAFAVFTCFTSVLSAQVYPLQNAPAVSQPTQTAELQPIQRLQFTTPQSLFRQEFGQVSMPVCPQPATQPLPSGFAPEAAPAAQPAPVQRLVAVNAVTQNYILKTVNAAAFEKKMFDKLGKKCVPVKNVHNAPHLAKYQLPVKDGTDVELTVDRQNNIVTLVGSPQMIESCLIIVRTFDSQDVNTEVIPIQSANIVAVKQAAQIVNQQTQAAAPATIPAPLPTKQPAAAEKQAENQPLVNNVIVGPVQIDIIDGLETMVIKGPAKDVAAIQAMIKQLESMSLEHEPKIHLYALKHADAYRVGQMVQQLYAQVYLARRGSLTLLPLVKPNTILLIGKQESLDTVKELIGKFDRPVDPNTQFQVFRLKNASAANLQTEITNFYNNTNRANQGLEPKVFVVSDFPTNTLIVQASPRDMVEVTALIQKLDVAGSDAVNVVKTFQLKNAIASELAVTLQNAISGTATGTGTTNTRGHDLTMNKVDGQGNLLRGNVLYDVKITADSRSNTLIVSAPANSMPLIEAVISELDKLPAARAQIKVFTLVNGDASTLVTVLTNLFAQTAATGGTGGGTTGASAIATVRPGIEQGESTLVSVRFQAETRTNSIIACGSPGDMAVVEALLIRLDEENMNNRKVLILKLVNTKAQDIATAVQTYVTQERQLEIQNSAAYYPQSPAEQYRKEVIVVPEIISNSLIISTTPRHYEHIKKIVKQLDERQLMVGIQVLIAEVRLTGNREEGIEMALQDSLLFDRAMVATGEAAGIPGFLFGNPSYGLPTGNTRPSQVGTQGITSLGTGRSSARSGVGGFTFAASSESVSILIRALEEKNKVRILSRPHLTTMHNNRATVKVGQDVPYVSSINSGGYSDSTNSAVQYREVGTILDVTPRITPDGRIVMAVYVEKSRVGSNTDGVPIGISNGQAINSPKIDITNAQTVVSANDNETIVFAGLITEEKEFVDRSVPYLNKIPLVKNFFQYKSSYCTRSELLIVMTPTILRSETDQAILRQQEAGRMNWCTSDVVRMTGNSKMQVRGDYIETQGVPVVHPGTVILDEKYLPSDDKVKPMLPMPTLAPEQH